MTTIAWDGNTLAADTLMVDSMGLKQHRSKIWQSKDFYAAGAGVTSEIHKFMRKLKSVENISAASLLDVDSTDAWIILVSKDRQYISDGSVFLSLRQPWALGSGRDFALAAMHLGKTAQEAVKVAMVFDNGTGGGVEVITVL